MSEARLRPQWLGRLGYRWAWRLQKLRRAAILEGRAPEAIWLLEHDPVITTGRRFVDGLPTDGPEVVRTERGGLATWHGPGQLVGYLMIDIHRASLSVKGTVCAVEAAVIHWLAQRGIQGTRRPRHPGVWVDDAKICAVGMHFRRGVSMHGFALNLCPDLAAFEPFVPCGIPDVRVTSLEALKGRAIAPHEVALEVGAHLVDTLSHGG